MDIIDLFRFRLRKDMNQFKDEKLTKQKLSPQKQILLLFI